MSLGLGLGLDKQRSVITFFGTFPANPYPGQTGLAPKYPLVESLPITVVNGQSWRIAEVGRDYGREYLGVAGAWVPQDTVTMARWVWEKEVSLDGPDTLQLPVVCSDLANNSWTVSFDVENENFRSYGYGDWFAMKDAGGNFVLAIESLPTDPSTKSGTESNLIIFNPLGDPIRYGLFLFDNKSYHRIDIVHNKNIPCIELYLDGLMVWQHNYTNTWTPSLVTSEYIRDDHASLRPLKIKNFSHKLNGSIIDQIPCNNIDGTTVKNTVNQSRTATLSDQTAVSSSWHLSSNQLPPKLIAIGDSITKGIGSTSGEDSWFSIGTDARLQMNNYAVGGTNTADFLDVLTNRLPIDEFTHVCYSPYTPNGMTPDHELTEAVAIEQKANFLLAYEWCVANGIKMIIMDLTSLNQYTPEQNAIRDGIIEYAYALTGCKINLIDEVFTQAPSRQWIDGCTVDGVHPNDYGYWLMRAKFRTELSSILGIPNL